VFFCLRFNNSFEITFFDLDAFVLQQFPELLNLLLEFSDELRVGILIDDGFADNLLGSVGVSARG
jgi:hypothetical protein